MAQHPADRFEQQRRALVEEIKQEVHSLRQMLGKSSLDPAVIDAISRVPRHEFVGVHQETLAYINHPLPIGYQQTISQPFIVALMTDLLGSGARGTVLEIGTGSGYQAAVLAELAARVYSVEIVEVLAESARERLQRLGYDNVEVRAGDGHSGWPEHAPYDAIIVTAAARAVPPALVAQLRAGARLVIPIGEPGETQWLNVLHKDEAGRIATRSVLPVAFVPLTTGRRG